jgi:hypothetical protein
MLLQVVLKSDSWSAFQNWLSLCMKVHNEFISEMSIARELL